MRNSHDDYGGRGGVGLEIAHPAAGVTITSFKALRGAGESVNSNEVIFNECGWAAADVR
jgi:hypothetical protein